MGNKGSLKEVAKLKCKTFRKTLERIVLTLEEYNQGITKEWELIKLILHDSILTIYLSNNLENSIELTKDVFTNINIHGQLIIAFNNNNKLLIWLFRSIDQTPLTEWMQALILSKRPLFIKDSSCNKCKSSFNSFKRKHHCRACGKILCNSCSNLRIKLESIGYKKKKRVCEECKNNIKYINSLFNKRENSLRIKT